MKDTTIIYLTVGEIPTQKNLISSQVLKAAKYYNNTNLFKRVVFISSIPISSIIMSYLRKKPVKFHWIDELPFKSFYYFSLINLNFKIVFYMRNMLVHREAITIIKKIDVTKDNKILFHCRSYLAAHVALEIKKILKETQVKVLFDMRSILSSEFYYMVGRYAKKIYIDAKEWERWLLKESDLSLLPSNRGIQLLTLENPDVNICKINITGMEYKSNIGINEVFESRWSNKIISYIGTVSQCNPDTNVTSLLKYLKSKIADLNVEVISSNYHHHDIKCKQLNHDEMQTYYYTNLATIVPGISIQSYFESIKLSTNFFSTKASEAISCGVPLIVNNNIKELAEFVRDNKCGIVFNFDDNGNVLFSSDDITRLDDIKYWYEMTVNAYKVSYEYSVDGVLNKYGEYYKKILT